MTGHRGAILQAWFQERLTFAGVLGRCTQQLGNIESELEEHHHRDHDRSRHKQNSFDDLHPSGALHATKDDVEDHQETDANND